MIIDPPKPAVLDTAEVWDMTLPWLPVYWDLEILARYRRAGYSFVSVTLQDWPPTLEGMRRSISDFKAIASKESTWLTFGCTLAEIDQGRRAGKLVLGLNSQETRPVGEDLSRVETLHQLGVRHMILAYNVRNIVADGCAEVGDAGLSNFGRRLVKEMGRVGIIVDCTHTGRRSSLEAIDLSAHPVIFSHSNPYAVCPHIRNIHDDQIRACAARGGVVGVVGVGAFLGDREARTETMFRHIDYVVQQVGPEHVGLGSDYVKIFPARDYVAEWDAISKTENGWPDPIDGWPDPTQTQIPVDDGRCFAPEQLHELTSIMCDHGYSVEVIKGILGGNFRRVYATTEHLQISADRGPE
jgi:membrane dipeptidase